MVAATTQLLGTFLYSGIAQSGSQTAFFNSNLKLNLNRHMVDEGSAMPEYLVSLFFLQRIAFQHTPHEATKTVESHYTAHLHDTWDSHTVLDLHALIRTLIKHTQMYINIETTPP